MDPMEFSENKIVGYFGALFRSLFLPKVEIFPNFVFENDTNQKHYGRYFNEVSISFLPFPRLKKDFKFLENFQQ
jgi:hypothetical protein